MSAELLLSRLEKVRQTGTGKWLARCPAHDDRSPSLSIRETDDGTVLLRCFASCSAAEIVESVGLQLSDLFPPRLPTGKHTRKSKAHRIAWNELFCAIETDLLALSIAFQDFVDGEPLSPGDAAFLSKRAAHLVDAIQEVRGE